MEFEEDAGRTSAQHEQAGIEAVCFYTGLRYDTLPEAECHKGK